MSSLAESPQPVIGSIQYHLKILTAMIGYTQNPTMITFIAIDMTEDGIKHVNVLHIIVATKGKFVPMVLVDKGSGLDIYYLKVVCCLG